jgi:hypothetical protein
MNDRSEGDFQVVIKIDGEEREFAFTRRLYI